MTLSPETASYWLCGVWYFTWWIAAVFASKAVSRPRPGGDLLHRVFAAIGTVLLFWSPTTATAFVSHLATASGLGPAAMHWILPLWVAPPIVGWTLCGGIVLSFAFCWWARLHLGRLWSGLVTTKADHRIVDTGPYRIVRHPIYTGVIAAACFTACIKASLPAFAGFGFLWLGFWMTARVEEAFLRQELGAGPYDAYRNRTPMLFPGMGTAR
jgi:protein-S-isoprenylcysteine O-methyltransferase Ste14